MPKLEPKKVATTEGTETVKENKGEEL